MSRRPRADKPWDEGRPPFSVQSLAGLRLSNFKAFSDPVEIPLRPITLVYGPNSAGKSSLIHSLVLMNESLRKGSYDIYRTQIGGDSVDLGGFQQFVHRRDSTRAVGIGWRFSDNSQLLPLIKAKETQNSRWEIQGEWEAALRVAKSGVEVDVTIGRNLFETSDERAQDTRVGVVGYSIGAGGSPFLKVAREWFARDEKFEFRVISINWEHPVVVTLLGYLEHWFSKDNRPVSRQEMISMIDNLMREQMKGNRIPLEDNNWIPRDMVFTRDETYLEKKRKEYRGGKGASGFRLAFSVILDRFFRSVYELVEQEVSSLKYVGPFRTYPPRFLFFAKYQDDDYKARGGDVFETISSDPTVMERLNRWLGGEFLKTPYKIAMMDYRAIEESPLHPRGADRITDFRFLDQRSGTMVSHRDVGFGLSQVLPVLVSAFAEKNRIIAIEQPEIHLHPALQSELGDVFIESALISDRKNLFILETHSEHLILRLQRRIRETAENRNTRFPLRPDDVSVLYVDPKADGGSRVIRLRIDEEGYFMDDWPHGFFDERLRELL